MTLHQRVCDFVDDTLSRHGELHARQLAALCREATGDNVRDSQLNGILHDDTSGRFVRVGRGTWALARLRRPH